jgi:Alcohol dehydrogenase transcription factor Myb/SANT-like
LPDFNIYFSFLFLLAKKMYPIKSEMDNKIISIVKKLPSLYDTSSADFKNSEIKQASWNKVSEVVEAPTETCKKRWRALRERYTREMRRKLANLDMTWPFYDSMTFLDNFIKLRSPGPSSLSASASVMTKTELQIEANEYEVDEDYGLVEEDSYIVVSSEPPPPLATEATPASAFSTPIGRLRKRKVEERGNNSMDEDSAYADFVALSLSKMPRLLNIRCKGEILKCIQKYVELDEMAE